MIVHPNAMENMAEMIMVQQRMILELQQQVENMQKRELQDDVEQLKKTPPKSRWKFWSS